MNNLVKKRFHSVKAFLSETETFLHEQEIANSVFITVLTAESKKEADKESSYYCSTLWDTKSNQLVFALFALKDSFIYGSGISSHISQEHFGSVVELLVKDFLSSSVPIKAIHSYEPVLALLKQTLEQQGNLKFSFMDDVWSYDIKQVTWSARSLETKNAPGTYLKQATEQDLPLLIQWTQGFLKDIEEDLTHLIIPDTTEICQEEVSQNHVFILYVNNVPVSMTWKRRPLRDGCSIAYVYTPNEHRGKGYGAVCVSICTELFLKEYKYVTLFVVASRDPHKNMYTGVGYKLFGKAGRFTVV